MEVYITHAKRTSVGSFMGSLSTIPAYKLGAHVIKAILYESALDTSMISEVIMGNVLTGGLGQNPARQSAISAGIPYEVPAFTVNKVCGSGLKAVMIAAQSIASGMSELVIAGGQENMSLGMHGTYVRSGIKFGQAELIDQMMYDGLRCAFSGVPMGITAENIAKKFNIPRDAQDEFAMHSHLKASNAQKQGKFLDEISPIDVTLKKNTTTIKLDEFIKPDTTTEVLARLKPAFQENGSVTAGNSSGINDGAAAMILASKEALTKHNLKPIARIASFASSGVDPDLMGIGPVPSSLKALSRIDWKISDLDLVEANEAFAAQSIYVRDTLGIDDAILNVNGGAIAIGHPIGASGARILVTLLHEMQRRSSKRALATLCIGGGMGVSMCLEGL